MPPAVRRLGLGDEDVVRRLAAREPLLDELARIAAMALYASLGGLRPEPDDVLWDFRWSAVR